MNAIHTDIDTHTGPCQLTCQRWIMDNNSHGYGKRIQVGAKGGREKAQVGITTAESEERHPHNRRGSFQSLNPREYQLTLCPSQTLPKGLS